MGGSRILYIVIAIVIVVGLAYYFNLFGGTATNTPPAGTTTPPATSTPAPSGSTTTPPSGSSTAPSGTSQ